MSWGANIKHNALMYMYTQRTDETLFVITTFRGWEKLNIV